MKRAMSWVIIVAKTWCHVVRNNAVEGGHCQCSIGLCFFGGSGGSSAMHRDATYGILQVTKVSLVYYIVGRLHQKGEGTIPNFAVERIHLLKRMTLELSAIQRLYSEA